MLRVLVAAALVAAVSAEPEADPQYYTYAPYQPVVSYYPQPQVAAYPQYQQVAPSSYAEPKKDDTSNLKPTLYNAEPIYADNPFGENLANGVFLSDVFGWNRGPEHFSKWLNVPVQLRNNRVRWRTDGQRMSNGFNSASGADPNKYTDKYSYPGSYQGRKKREAEPQQYIVSPYTYSFPQYQPVAAPVQVEPAQVEKSYVPTTYAASPGWLVGQTKGTYLPGVFGWDRGYDRFSKWLDVPVQLRNNRVRWRTDGQRMSNGFNSASGADPNKYTDKYSSPGSYQGRKKREAEPQYVVSAYSYPQYQPVATPVQSAYVPTTYAASASPGFLVGQTKGTYLPGVFGWDRGYDRFSKWLDVPVQLRNNRVRWRTDGQRMSNGFNSASGADPNKYTDKYSSPGSYQG